MQQSLLNDEGDIGVGKREVDNPYTKSSSRRWGLEVAKRVTMILNVLLTADQFLL